MCYKDRDRILSASILYDEDILTTPKEAWTISQLAQKLDISPSQIRYYEQRKLLSPKRSKGGQRIFSKNDQARLKLILRGKRFGMSLNDISAILGLSSDQRPEIDQIRDALDHVGKIITDLHMKKKEIGDTIKEVDVFIGKMRTRLAFLEKQ